MSYLEILAENDTAARQEYDANAKDLLVEHNEYEETVEAADHHPDELENQDDFKKFGGSHQQAAGPAPSREYVHVLKNSIHHDKHVKTHVINIDSRFRSNTDKASTDFLFVLNRPMKNILSVRVSSIELPNTYYAFSRIRGNVTFTIFILNVPTVITLPNGNYTNAQMILSLNAILASKPATAGISVALIDTSGLMYFYSTTVTFDIDFELGNIFNARSSDWGLGYALGFRIRNVNKQRQYVTTGPNNIGALIVPGARTCYIGSSILDTLDANYLLLTLAPDWKVVQNYAPDRTQHFSFMKIIMTSGKNSVLFDNGANTLTKEYAFSQPTNLTSFPVRLSDPYDQTIDLNGMEFSFTMEIKEILDSALYESIRSS